MPRTITRRDELTPLMKRFVEEYVIDYCATDAVLRAGSSARSRGAAGVMGCNLLKNPVVKRAIFALERETSEKLEITRDEILTELFYCATRTGRDFVDVDTGEIITDVHRLPTRAQKTIDSIEQDVVIYKDREGNETGRKVTTKLRLTPKLSAIDMAMKHKGLFAPVETINEHRVQFNWDQLAMRVDEPDLIEAKIADTLDVNPLYPRRTQDVVNQPSTSEASR